MFRKLHLQLTALCAAVTGLILAVLTVICLFISESGILKREYANFQTDLTTLYQNLSLQNSLSHTWLRQMEYNYQISLRLTDGGEPLFFQDVSGKSESEELMGLVAEKALEDYGLNLDAPGTIGKLIRHEEFNLKDSGGQSYYASAALVPRAGGYISATAVRSLSQIQTRILRQRISFVLADTAAWLVLLLFFWFFTARMIRPLQKSQEKQTQFIASASHELRSPLTVILSNVDAVRSGSMPCDDQFMDTLTSESSRMSRLVDDMLQLARSDNHTWNLNPAETEMDTLLLQTWENFEAQAAARKIRWEIRLPEEATPRCFCDGERIRQLLAILIDNAFSYTPEGGSVSLTLSLGSVSDFPGISGAAKETGKTSHLFISVADNGPGIPDEQKDAVFERFYRVDSSRTDKSHFGLGLSIAREIARLHRGQLLLTDTPGGGATFVIALPLGTR